MQKARFNPFTRWFLAAIGLLFLGLALYLGQALAQEHPPATQRVTILPDRIIMPPQIPAAVQLTDYQVHTTVQDQLATTTITQTYKNTSNHTLEARYLFPLPPDAQFSSFTLTVNGQALEGKILEKAQARKTYQDIVRKLIDPGLLDYLDDQTVQVSIAPFFAGDTKTIRLSYSQLLPQDGGLYKYSYFLGSQAPGTIHRPGPVPRTCRPWEDCAMPEPHAPGGKTSTPSLRLTLDLKTAQALKTIYSPTHDPKITRQNDKTATIQLEIPAAKAQAEKQFVLYFSQDNRTITLNSLNYRRPGEDGYFLMTVRTPDDLQTEVLPKDVVLVLDTSGSMSGEKIRQAKQALRYIINHLRPEDRFGLLQFNTDVSAFQNELSAATAANKQAALDYVDSLNASGSTHIEAALKTGFAQLKNHDPRRPAYVIFLTDGEPTVGITDTPGLIQVARQANAHQAKLFNFGVGYNLNTLLLSKLAEGHHGSTTFVEPNEDLELAMTGFYQKIEAPVLTDARLDFSGVQVSKRYPEKLGDLFAGSEVILLGRYTGSDEGSVRLSGQMGQQAQSYRFPLKWADSTRHNQLPRLWAGRRIAYLLENIRLHGENTELKDEIIALSKQYGIITPYTSFLSIEPEQEGRSVPAAAPMANRAAMDAVGGQGAVQFSKRLKAMQTQASASALNEAQAASGPAAESKQEAPRIQSVGQKTFIRDKDGIWVDTAYDAQKHGQPRPVTFGTDAYFDLLTQKPELAPYFSLGEQVIVRLAGITYQVLPASTP